MAEQIKKASNKGVTIGELIYNEPCRHGCQKPNYLRETTTV
jgi:hypothetical protein